MYQFCINQHSQYGIILRSCSTTCFDARGSSKCAGGAAWELELEAGTRTHAAPAAVGHCVAPNGSAAALWEAATMVTPSTLDAWIRAKTAHDFKIERDKQ
jgi:hypothetical protein